MDTCKRPRLAQSLGLKPGEWLVVREAAADAHLTAREYCRLMALAAAGMGGVIEQLQRAVHASMVVDDAATQRRVTKRRKR